MAEKLEIYKKKLLYRASYRGTKEMDLLLSKFVKKYLDIFNLDQLSELEKFLDYEDEIILDFYNFNNIKNDIDKNKIASVQKFLNMMAERWGRTHEQVPRCWFSRPVLSTTQPLLILVDIKDI